MHAITIYGYELWKKYVELQFAGYCFHSQEFRCVYGDYESLRFVLSLFYDLTGYYSWLMADIGSTQLLIRN